MIVKVPVTGQFQENCYFFLDPETLHGFVIDPGAQAQRLLRIIGTKGWTIEAILLTHGHFDHIGAVDELRTALGAPVRAHCDAARYLDEAKTLLAGVPDRGDRWKTWLENPDSAPFPGLSYWY